MQEPFPEPDGVDGDVRFAEHAPHFIEGVSRVVVFAVRDEQNGPLGISSVTNLFETQIKTIIETRLSACLEIGKLFQDGISIARPGQQEMGLRVETHKKKFVAGMTGLDKAGERLFC